MIRPRFQPYVGNGVLDAPIGIAGKVGRGGLRDQHPAFSQVTPGQRVKFAAIEFAQALVIGVGQVNDDHAKQVEVSAR